jgi:hypothetical protein
MIATMLAMNTDRAARLRHLINAYRERLRGGEDRPTVAFIIDGLRDAERRLASLELAGSTH